jgi:hypothetical protein
MSSAHRRSSSSGANDAMIDERAASRKKSTKKKRNRKRLHPTEDPADEDAKVQPAPAAAASASSSPKRQKASASDQQEHKSTIAPVRNSATAARQPRQPQTEDPAADDTPEDMVLDDAAQAADPTAASIPSRRFNCDSDSLSLILSFLNLRDFRSGTQVSRRFIAAGSTHTAWPKQSIDELIQSLQANNYDDPKVRRLRITPQMYRDGLTRLLHSRCYSKVNDVHFTTPQYVNYLGDRKHVQSAMLALAKLPYLQALNLNSVLEYVGSEGRDTGLFLDRFCSALGPKLRALFLTDISESPESQLVAALEPHLHHLQQLRVLVIDSGIHGDVLWQLKHLEFLHCRCRVKSGRSMLEAIRTLSVEHSLKKVSLECDDSFAGSFVVKYLCEAELAPSQHERAMQTFTPTKHPSQLTTFTCTAEFSTLNFMQLVSALPMLQHLELAWQPDEAHPWDLGVPLPPLLAVLKLSLAPMDWHRQVVVAAPHPFLPPCPSVQVLTLLSTYHDDFQEPKAPLKMSHSWMASLLAETFPHVQRLRIGDWEPPFRSRHRAFSHDEMDHEDDDEEVIIPPLMAEEKEAEVASLRELAKCQKLESLDLQLLPQVSFYALLPLIQQLPRFNTLEVTSYPSVHDLGLVFELPPELYSTIASHPTFRTLYVHLSHHEGLYLECIHMSDLPVRGMPRNTWWPNSSVMPAYEEILGSIEENQREAAMERLHKFRLYRQEGATVNMYALQSTWGGETIRWIEVEQL